MRLPLLVSRASSFGFCLSPQFPFCKLYQSTLER